MAEEITKHESIRPPESLRISNYLSEWESRLYNETFSNHDREDHDPNTPLRFHKSIFTKFENSEYAVDIPIRREGIWPPVRHEIESITDDMLSSEQFQYLYRHLEMLIYFHKPDPALPDNLNTTPVIKRNIETIIKRGKTECKEFEKKVRQQHLQSDMNFKIMACLRQCESDPGSCLSPEIIEMLYNDGISGDPDSIGFVQYALAYDNRNITRGTSIGIENRFKEYILPKILSNSDEDKTIVNSYLDLRNMRSTMLIDLLVSSLTAAESQEQMISTVQKFAPVVGIEMLRKSLRDHMTVTPSFRPVFNTVFEYLGLDQGEEIAIDLGQDVYGKNSIDMDKEYSPYQETLSFELDLLEKELQGSENVMDLGCGTGRIMIPLSERIEAKVSGFDLFKPDIDKIKKSHPDMDVKAGSWFDIPYPDNSFQSAYCLGRSLTHNLTLPDMFGCLKEIRRVLKKEQKSPGFVLVDLPDPDTGEYKEFINSTIRTAQEKGINNILPGLINDSPDTQHYFDRFAPSDTIFIALANLAGFDIEKIASSQYKGPSGIENKNNYWKLKVGRIPTLSGENNAMLINRLKNTHINPYSPTPDQTMLS